MIKQEMFENRWVVKESSWHFRLIKATHKYRYCGDWNVCNYFFEVFLTIIVLIGALIASGLLLYFAGHGYAILYAFILSPEYEPAGYEGVRTYLYIPAAIFVSFCLVCWVVYTISRLHDKGFFHNPTVALWLQKICIPVRIENN